MQLQNFHSEFECCRQQCLCKCKKKKSPFPAIKSPQTKKKHKHKQLFKEIYMKHILFSVCHHHQNHHHHHHHQISIQTSVRQTWPKKWTPIKCQMWFRVSIFRFIVFFHSRVWCLLLLFQWIVVSCVLVWMRLCVCVCALSTPTISAIPPPLFV